MVHWALNPNPSPGGIAPSTLGQEMISDGKNDAGNHPAGSVHVKGVVLTHQHCEKQELEGELEPQEKKIARLTAVIQEQQQCMDNERDRNEVSLPGWHLGLLNHVENLSAGWPGTFSVCW